MDTLQNMRVFVRVVEAGEPVHERGKDREAHLDRRHPPAAGHAAAHLEVGQLFRLVAEPPDELRPALERALGSGEPTLVNVLTDPSVAYPRKSNLA